MPEAIEELLIKKQNTSSSRSKVPVLQMIQQQLWICSGLDWDGRLG